MKVALITGITGQDGSYLAELLAEKGYEVHGLIRRASSYNTSRIDLLCNTQKSIKLHYGDLSDSSNLIRLVKEIQPDEIYNLAAMSHVAVSFESPEYTADVSWQVAVRPKKEQEFITLLKDLTSDNIIYKRGKQKQFPSAINNRT